MNYNTREMIKLYSLCTGNTNRHEIIKILSMSPIFSEVKKGSNDCLNYEGYISNLLDIVDDLRGVPECPSEIDLVRPDVIAAINRTEQKDAYKQKTLRERLFAKTEKVALF